MISLSEYGYLRHKHITLHRWVTRGNQHQFVYEHNHLNITSWLIDMRAKKVFWYKEWMLELHEQPTSSAMDKIVHNLQQRVAAKRKGVYSQSEVIVFIIENQVRRTCFLLPITCNAVKCAIYHKTFYFWSSSLLFKILHSFQTRPRKNIETYKCISVGYSNVISSNQSTQKNSTRVPIFTLSTINNINYTDTFEFLIVSHSSDNKAMEV